MILRPYQEQAVGSVTDALEQADSALVVMPTGTGKTVCFAEVIKRRIHSGRALMIAHREELVFQGSEKIRQMMPGYKVQIEMANFRSHREGWYKADIVVGSVPTMCNRLADFPPDDFATLICDEAHHAICPTYLRIFAHFRQNPRLKVVGVTATPDRHDEAALGQVFARVAYEYGMADAIHDGWLVPIRQKMIRVESLDFSLCRTTAGDLNGADLARVMEIEENLHAIATPTLDIYDGRRTLVFTVTVAQAERITEIFNRHTPDVARFVCGKTPKDERRQLFADYKAGKFKILCNVGVATEGFDEPGVSVVVMGRPTKSRALFSQMIGRGTRPLPGVVDGPDTNELRRDAIMASEKPSMLVVDFTGNCGKHKLVHAPDVLGEDFSDEAIERASALAEDGDERGVDELLEEGDQEWKREKEEEEARQREYERTQAHKRKEVKARVEWTSREADPFNVFDLAPHRIAPWHQGRMATDKMVAMLKGTGVADADKLPFPHAQQIVKEIIDRRNDGRCTYKQAKLLGKYGYDPNSTFDEARVLIDQIAANGWRKPK